MSELLRSLTKNERIAHFFEQIAHLLIFLQTMSDSLRKPMSEFPALENLKPIRLRGRIKTISEKDSKKIKIASAMSNCMRLSSRCAVHVG